MLQSSDQADAFIQRLRDRFVSGEMDPDLDQPMRIQISSRVVYREGDTSKLTDADISIIEAALNANPAAEMSESSQVGKAVNIDLAGERVFRYKNGVEIDTSKPVQMAQPTAPATLEERHPGEEGALFYELVLDDVSPLLELQSEPTPSDASVGFERTDDTQPLPDPQPPLAVGESSSLETPAKLSATAIAWARLADKLPEASKEWLTQASEKFAAVADSGFGQELKQKGAEAAKAAWTQLSNLGEQSRNRAIADSVVALTKEFGQFQGQGNQQRWVYESERFRVEVKGTNAYILSDHEGNKLYSFKSDRWRGPTQVESNLNPMQQFDLVRAGTQLTAAKTWEATQNLVERTQQLADRLGDLAPKGTRERLLELSDRQAARFAETLSSSSEAVRNAAGSFFDGKPFKAFKSAATETVGLLREGIEGGVLRQDANGELRSRLGLRDLGLVRQIQQKLDNSWLPLEQQRNRVVLNGKDALGCLGNWRKKSLICLLNCLMPSIVIEYSSTIWE